MGEVLETLPEHRRSFAAPIVFVIVVAFQFFSRWLQHLKKVLTYIVLLCWFWRVPVASLSQQLVQPFGKVISRRAGGVVNETVMVGIIPWLILSTRVSKFVCRLAKF